MSSKKTVAAAAAVSAPASIISAVAKRNSRLPTEAVLSSLRSAGPAGLTVPSMAEKLACAERDVRLAIDALRVKKFDIKRCALKTFALSA